MPPHQSEYRERQHHEELLVNLPLSAAAIGQARDEWELTPGHPSPRIVFASSLRFVGRFTFAPRSDIPNAVWLSRCAIRAHTAAGWLTAPVRGGGAHLSNF